MPSVMGSWRISILSPELVRAIWAGFFFLIDSANWKWTSLASMSHGLLALRNAFEILIWVVWPLKERKIMSAVRLVTYLCSTNPSGNSTIRESKISWILSKLFSFSDTISYLSLSIKKAKSPVKATWLFVKDILHTVSPNRCLSLVIKPSGCCD